MLEVVLRPRAKADLLNVADYTKTEHGEKQAKQYVEDIRRQIDSAARFPGIGSNVFGLPDAYRKMRSGSHRIIYRYNETELLVVRILHEREDVPDEIEDSL
ncbi:MULTISPECIES: type II toxin-antitoxin system RelE/ParE family toxin [unclassified Sphingopyxis]|jgi:toxin ParE1/3/4|uniref:type II toxin-antitoxin system RelE/ParE family toxin n=1 Tax=unclassified Sphingopyxis TaxID=2614943 RepID=UPI0025DEB562|nr:MULTISPECIES: type II toxin-antitoxin system RelE/ParE family toxin [unclassified Sphingopyxis]